jgi:hypothetical protein
MGTFDDDAQTLLDAAARRDRVVAWEATGRLVSRFSDQSTFLDPEKIFSLVWKGAAKYRWFDIAEVLSGTAAARPDAPPSTRRLHAQMLMERGYTEEALSRLQTLLGVRNLTDFDLGQAYGHIGRMHKDRFVSAVAAGDEQSARSSLRLAVDAYRTGYLRVPKEVAWLGINAVALLSRPEAAQIERDARTEAQQLAREIKAAVAARPVDLYADATVAEACLALGEYTAAFPLVARYVFDPKVNGFALNNFHRQLKEIWRIDKQSSPGPEILTLVAAALLEKPDGFLTVSRGDLRRVNKVNNTEYEAVFGADRFDSIDNYRRGLERSSCVARIGRTAETGVGTGFLIRGRVLSTKLDDRFVLVTNAHVINEVEAEREQGALHPLEAIVTFADLEGVPPNKEFRLTGVIFSTLRSQLDAVVAELSEPILAKSEYPIAEVPPVAGSQATVRIIGHPSGRGLSFSVNQLLDYEVPKLHYRTASEGGSSGSPVFNHQWTLMGLHHAGGDAVPRLRGQTGTYQANEGIWMGSIREAIHAYLP